MQIQTFDASDHAGWEAQVRACGGNGLHMPGVYLPDHDPGTIRLLTFGQDGSTVACGLAIEAAPGLLGRLRGRERGILLPTAPAIADAAHAEAVRDALFANARERGAARLRVQPGYGTWLGPDPSLARFRTESITEFVLDLTPGYDAVLAGMHKIHRKNIRRASRAGLEVVEDSSVEGLLRLRRMQLSSSERAEEKTEGFAVRDEEYFRRVHDHVYAPGLGTVLFVHLEEEAVAALAWLEAAGRILTVRSGSLPAGYESRAMYLLHDELIRRALDHGITELNIGGVPTDAAEKGHPQAGLYEFKQGFGGVAMQRHGLDIPLQEVD
jgi:hypothetical protein